MDKINNKELENRFNINLKYLFFILIILIVIILVGWGGIMFLMKEVSCGDGICDSSETADECPGDCKVLQKEDIEAELILCKKDAEKLCLAIIDKEEAYCNSIEFEGIKQRCYEKIIIIHDIFENKDEGSCSKMSEISEKECINIVNSIKAEDITKCEDSLCEDVFTAYLADLQKNVSLCEDIINEEIKSSCRLYLTSNMNYCDYSYCSDVYNIHMREESNNLSYCEEVINPTGKQACLEYESK